MQRLAPLTKFIIFCLVFTAATTAAGIYYSLYAALQDSYWRDQHRGSAVVTNCLPCQSTLSIAGKLTRLGIAAGLLSITLLVVRWRQRTRRDGS